MGVSLFVWGRGKKREARRPLLLLLSRVENDFQPARAAADELSGVALSPAFHKAYLHREARARLLRELVVVGPLKAAGLIIVKSFDGETGEHLVHQQRARVRVVQCGRLNEDGVAAAVIDPHPVWLTRQLDAIADLGPHHLHQLGLVVRAELAQTEAVPLR